MAKVDGVVDGLVPGVCDGELEGLGLGEDLEEQLRFVGGVCAARARLRELLVGVQERFGLRFLDVEKKVLELDSQVECFRERLRRLRVRLDGEGLSVSELVKLENAVVRLERVLNEKEKLLLEYFKMLSRFKLDKERADLDAKVKSKVHKLDEVRL